MSLVEVKSNTASTSFLTEDTEVSQLTTTQRIQPHDSNNTPHTLLSTLSHTGALSPGYQEQESIFSLLAAIGLFKGLPHHTVTSPLLQQILILHWQHPA